MKMNNMAGVKSERSNSEVSEKQKFKVPYVDLKKTFLEQRTELLERLEDVCLNSRFILRGEVNEFEKEISRFLGVKHAIGVGSGTDALFLSLKAIGIGSGDEVITVGHTFVATIAAIVHCGADPVLVDISEDDFNIDPVKIISALTTRTRAIIPVHLNGRSCKMELIKAIASESGIAIVEDAAQALGTRYMGQMAGSMGDAGCFSFHPLKTLSCFGDGGMAVTDNDDLAEKIRLYRDHGQQRKTEIVLYGYNSRLDNLQAAVLLTKMKKFPEKLKRRRQIAELYNEGLTDIAGIHLPYPPEDAKQWDTYSSYVIRTSKREALKEHLLSEGIEVFVHWSPPLNRQYGLGLHKFSLPVTEKVSDEVLSLPVYPEMSDEQASFVISAIRNFFGKG